MVKQVPLDRSLIAHVVSRQNLARQPDHHRRDKELHAAQRPTKEVELDVRVRVRVRVRACACGVVRACAARACLRACVL